MGEGEKDSKSLSYFGLLCIHILFSCRKSSEISLNPPTLREAASVYKKGDFDSDSPLFKGARGDQP